MKMKKIDLFLTFGAGLMTFGFIFNYLNGDYAWALIQFKIALGIGVVAFLRNRNIKNKWCTK